MGLSRARQLQLLQHQVASAALSGVKAHEIERSLIAPSTCAEDDKAALWLYAFSFLPRFEQRRIALDRLRAAVAQDARSRSGPSLPVAAAPTDDEAAKRSLERGWETSVRRKAVPSEGPRTPTTS